MRAPSRLWIDNLDERFIRVSPEPSRWIEILPFRPVVNSIELESICWLFFAESDPASPVVGAYRYDGECLWTKTADELPLPERIGWYGMSSIRSGAETERHLTRGNAFCTILDAIAPRFGPVQWRRPRAR